jgi:hypothetical protein
MTTLGGKEPVISNTGTSKMGKSKKRGHRKKSGELNFKIPQYGFVENYKKCLITSFSGTKKNTRYPHLFPLGALKLWQLLTGGGCSGVINVIKTVIET